MEDYKKIFSDMKKNVDTLLAISNSHLQKIREHDPKKIDEILRDQNQVIKAIQNKDMEAINKLQKKYADNTN